jgi:hypothetical protein
MALRLEIRVLSRSHSICQPTSLPVSQLQLCQLMNLVCGVCVLHAISHTNNYLFMSGNQQNFPSRFLHLSEILLTGTAEVYSVGTNLDFRNVDRFY